MTLDSQQVELIGRAALEAELIRHGFEVARRTATRGVDDGGRGVAQGHGPFRPVFRCPAQGELRSEGEPDPNYSRVLDFGELSGAATRARSPDYFPATLKLRRRIKPF